MRKKWTDAEVAALRRIAPGLSRVLAHEAYNIWAASNGYPERSHKALDFRRYRLRIPSGVPQGRPGHAVQCVESGEVFMSVAEAARNAFVTYGALWAHLKGQTATCVGKRWRYVDEGR